MVSEVADGVSVLLKVSSPLQEINGLPLRVTGWSKVIPAPEAVMELPIV